MLTFRNRLLILLIGLVIGGTFFKAFVQIVILLLTAVAEAVTSTNYTHWEGKSTLADDYIPKPIDLAKLMEIVKDYLS